MPRTYYHNFRQQMDANNEMIAIFADDHNMSRDWFVYQPLETHPIVTSAVRKAAILSPYVTQFAEDLRSCVTSYEYNHLSMLYPVIWNKDKTGVIVFPNIPLDNFLTHRYSRHTLDRETPWFPKHLSSLKNTILYELTHEHKRKAWLPTSRGIKRLGIRKEMSLTRALSRCFVKSDGEIIKNAQDIDNMAQRMLELHMPSEFHIAETVEDIRRMYIRSTDHRETPSSCMDSQHSFRLPRGVRPVDFYGHCPNTKGVYLARGGTVLARAICWYDTNANAWFTSRVYSSRSANAEELLKRCEEVGIQKGEDHHIVSNCEFTIPTEQFEGKPCIPMPYFDRRPFNIMAVKHNGADYKVVLGNKRFKGWEYPHLESTQGSHMSNQEFECNSCGDTIDTDDDNFVNVNGDIYCCHGCACEQDAVLYVTGNAEEYMYDRDIPRDCVLTIDNNVVFSNRHAAISRHQLYRPVPWADTEGDMFCHHTMEDSTQFFTAGCVELSKGETAAMRLYASGYLSHNVLENIPNVDKFLHVSGADRDIRPLSITAEVKPMTSSEIPRNSVGDYGIFHSVFADEYTQSNFSNADFDEHLEGLLNPPAQLTTGVHTIEELRR